jgi:3',5'-cyclic AMP phosphodiesterase CpdA
MTTLTIAQLSDVHLGPIVGFSPRYWNAKRLAGYLNWRFKRRSAFERTALAAILSDLEAAAPDHIAVTGDLANIGLPAELVGALGWLGQLGPPGRVSVVPGNHDIYGVLRHDRGTARWIDYMTSDASGAPLAGGAGFPFVRLVGNVALIGVNTARPTPPLMAWGEVGAEQLDRLAAILDRVRRAQLFRLVALHHPPLPGQSSRSRGLKDAEKLERVFAAHGAELVIHGHHHRNMFALAKWAQGTAAVVGAASASLGRARKNEPLARYNVYRIEGGGPWRVSLAVRGLAARGARVVEVERREFRVGPAA